MLRLLIVLLGMSSAWCHAEWVVSDATVRLLPPSVPNTAAYFSIENRSPEVKVLVAASSNIANKTELHNHVMVNNMMRMQQQHEIKVQPGQKIDFQPGGLHIMLFGLNQVLSEKQVVNLSLKTKEGGSIDFTAIVTRPSDHKHH